MININNSKKEAFLKPPFFISYLITDPKEYGNDIKTFSKNLTNSLSKYHIDTVFFRDKETLDVEELAKTCLSISKQFNIPKVVINSNIDLAIKLGFDGVHLTSKQFDKIKTAKKNNLYVIISCHTQEEVSLAKNYNADAVTYSPIFYKENKGKPKGIENLSKVVKKIQDNNFFIIALGGIIENKHIEEIKKTNAKGFASIRYFTN